MSSPDLDAIREMMRELLREELKRYRLLDRSPDKTAAERMRRYRARKAKADRNVASPGDRNTSKGNGATLRNGKRKEEFVFPEWLVPHRDVWDAWVEARGKSKKPPTDWAKSLAVAKLERLQEQGHNVRGLLADAAFHNWQSFYPRDGGKV